jgi:hypothetical protein
MQGLGDGDQIDRVVGETAGVGRSGIAPDPWVGRHLGDLPGTGVGSDHVLEVAGQRESGLPVAGAAVPGTLARRCLLREIGEQRRRIAGPCGGIRGRNV